jgi:rhodanese-related sulfurtransferase
MFGRATLRDLQPAEVQATMAKGEAILIDVREPEEFAAEHIHGALNIPLAAFDPRALPDCGSRTVIFQCRSGGRSAMAVRRCQAAGLSFDAHLAGGLMNWRRAGLTTVTHDPATDAPVDPS